MGAPVPALLGVAAALAIVAAGTPAGHGGSSAAGGDLIAFFGNEVNRGRGGIYTIRSDGTRLRRLTRPSLWISPGKPTWSPDGRRIAFAGSPDGVDYDLWVMDADGRGLRLLADTPGHALDPDWSPDGRSIAFTSLRPGSPDRYDIVVVGANGRGLRQLTTSPAEDRAPDWSPDGKRIAFASNRLDGYHVWVMDADGGRQRRLTRGGVPEWSPDGRRIAYASRHAGGDPEILVARADGSAARALTRNRAEDWPPSWSPDGRRIAFGSTRGRCPGGCLTQLHVMNDDGSGQRRVTRFPRGFAHYPAWRPEPPRRR